MMRLAFYTERGMSVIFEGISKVFSLAGEQQYETIGQFWDEIAVLYGLENLQGLGYNWKGNKMSYAIGLKTGCIEGCNVRVELPEHGWVRAVGKTDDLKQLYDEIYRDGPLEFEIETFDENGDCQILFYRKTP